MIFQKDNKLNECVHVRVCVTCGVLPRDERLSAESLGARYPTGNTD